MTDPAFIRPLTFHKNIVEYCVQQTSNTGPPQGSMFTLNESNSVNYTNRSLLLLRFIIGMHVATS